MVTIPRGRFLMGSNDIDDEEKPVHPVHIKTFMISKYAITNTQFCKFLKEKGNQEEGGVSWLEYEESKIEKRKNEYIPIIGMENHPVTGVSWYGARAFCKWAGGRLPSESEWEYAARGGEDYKYAGSDNINDVAWCWSNSGQVTLTREVGTKKANGFGLYDMSGNVWEWCEDDYHDSYNGAPTGGQAWLSGESDVLKVLRGGSCGESSSMSRVGYRYFSVPGHGYCNYGFRLVC